MILNYVLYCPRCSFRAHISATRVGIEDRTECFCPLCRRNGLDAFTPRSGSPLELPLQPR